MADKLSVTGAAPKEQDSGDRYVRLPRAVAPNPFDHKKGVWVSLEAARLPGSQASDDLYQLGIVQVPFNRELAAQLSADNEYQRTCLDVYVSTAFEQGHVDEEVEAALDPLCPHGSWAAVLSAAGLDFFELGDGFIEVIRESWEPNAPIAAIHPVLSAGVHIHVERAEDGSDLVWYTSGSTEGSVLGLSAGSGVHASFGDLERFMRKQPATADRKTRPSEFIQLRRPNNKSRWYGYPGWLASAPTLELMRAMTQYEMDYYYNRGVPEFMLFITGATVETAAWDKLVKDMQSLVGVGQAHQSLAYNFGSELVKVQMEKMALEEPKGQEYSDKRTGYALAIVTAHGVPLTLAGIQVPGKMGANNELPNALAAFQITRVEPQQKLWSKYLANTLGDSLRNGGLGLRPEHFLGTNQEIEHPQAREMKAMGMPVPEGKKRNGNGFRTVLEGLDMQALQGLTKMRSPMAGSSRDPSEGAKERGPK